MLKNVSKRTIIRTAVFMLGLINQILTMTGHNVLPINDKQLSQTISDIWVIVSGIIVWWKNNSFTSAAIDADAYMKELKATPKEE